MENQKKEVLYSSTIEENRISDFISQSKIPIPNVIEFANALSQDKEAASKNSKFATMKPIEEDLITLLNTRNSNQLQDSLRYMSLQTAIEEMPEENFLEKNEIADLNEQLTRELRKSMGNLQMEALEFEELFGENPEPEQIIKVSEEQKELPKNIMPIIKRLKESVKDPEFLFN